MQRVLWNTSTIIAAVFQVAFSIQSSRLSSYHRVSFFICIYMQCVCVEYLDFSILGFNTLPCGW